MNSAFSPTRAVLLDLDGTLADTAPDFGGALNRMLVRHGRLPVTFAEYRPLVGDGSRALIELGFEIDSDNPAFQDLRTELLNEYEARLCETTTLFPGMFDLIETLESHGIQWGVMTNKPDYLTRPLMQRLGLATRTKAIVSADNVQRAKPAPDGLLEAASRLGLTAESCLYVGDARRDIEAGHAAGMKTIAAAWGYIKPEDDPATWNAHAVVSRAREILDHLSPEPHLQA